MGLLKLHDRKCLLRVIGVLAVVVLAVGLFGFAESAVFAQENGGAPKAAAPGEGGAAGSEGRSVLSVFRRLIYIFFDSLLFNFDSWYFGVGFLLLSLILGILVIVLLLDLRLGGAIPLGFVEEFTNIINRRQFKQAFDLCRSDNSFLGRVLQAGMGRLQYGIDDSRHAAGNMVESIRRGKDQIINYVAIIGTVAPLIGLFGTVWGMIGAFQDIAFAGTEPQPQQIAGNISQALATTWVGILLAVPALFFNTFFRNRLTRITMDTSNLADDLLTQMYHNSRKPGAPAAQTAVPAAAPNQQGIKPK